VSEPQVNRPGSDVAAVEILGGEQGARVLDEYGRYHGLRGRVVRTLQGFGYDGTTLAIYDEALRKGDLLLLAALLQRRFGSSGCPGPRAVSTACRSEVILAIHRHSRRNRHCYRPGNHMYPAGPKGPSDDRYH